MKYFLLSTLFLASCVTRKACESKFGHCGQIETRTVTTYRDSTIYLPGLGLRDTFYLPTDTFFKPQVRTVYDSTGRLQLTWYRDAYNRVVADCNAKPDTIEIEKASEKTIEYLEKTVEKDVIPWYVWGIIGVLAVLLILALAR